MSELKPCPFCGSGDIYETYSEEHLLGTKNPEIFCNSCKAIFSIEDDSPYMNCDEDFAYRKGKTREAWNRRKSGYWIKPKGKEYGVCSNCAMNRVDLVGGNEHNYCEVCGAKMEGVKEI